MQCSIAWHWMPCFRIKGCAHGSRIAWLVMPRFESMAARMAAASLGTWCLARIRYCMQCSIAWHWMPCFRIKGCAHESRIAWLATPRFESMAARMAATLLGTWCLARISCCIQCSIAWHWMPRYGTKGCAHGSSVAWFVMPRFESMAARMAAASPGTWCLVSLNQELHARQHRLAPDASLQNQWLRTWQQDCLARDASLRINGCTHGGSMSLGTWCLARTSCYMQCSIAWHQCLASGSMAAHMAAALLGS
jgi:hypothetical protein